MVSIPAAIVIATIQGFKRSHDHAQPKTHGLGIGQTSVHRRSANQIATALRDSSVNHALPDFPVKDYIGSTRNGPLLIRPGNDKNIPHVGWVFPPCAHILPIRFRLDERGAEGEIEPLSGIPRLHKPGCLGKDELAADRLPIFKRAKFGILVQRE